MNYPDPQTHTFMTHPIDFPPPLGWVLVSVVAVSSGGGSYEDREQRKQIAGVSSRVLGVFARPIEESDRAQLCARMHSAQYGGGARPLSEYPEWLQAKPWEKGPGQ